MKIHEYQAKQLLARYGVPVPAGVPADTPAEGETATQQVAFTLTSKTDQWLSAFSQWITLA